MLKQIKINFGDTLEVTPPYGGKIYINSWGETFSSLEEAKKHDRYGNDSSRHANSNTAESSPLYGTIKLSFW